MINSTSWYSSGFADAIEYSKYIMSKLSYDVTLSYIKVVELYLL